MLVCVLVSEIRDRLHITGAKMDEKCAPAVCLSRTHTRVLTHRCRVARCFVAATACGKESAEMPRDLCVHTPKRFVIIQWPKRTLQRKSG